MKKLLFSGISLFTAFFILMVGCKKEDPEDTKPPYYFRFYADGKYFDYQCQFTEGYLGGWNCPYGAFPPGASITESYYQIFGEDRSDDLSIRGRLTFFLDPDDFPVMDTIILDGLQNRIRLKDLNYYDDNYRIEPPLSGQLIIIERGDGYLKGKFEFQAFHINYEGGTEWTVTDTIINITGGEFYIQSNF